MHLFRLVRALLNLVMQIWYQAAKRIRSLPVVILGDGEAVFKSPAVLNCLKYIILAISELTTWTSTLGVLFYCFVYDLPPEFSVHLTPIPSNNCTVATPRAFHVDLHASNRRATGRCYHHGEGAVTYGGFTVVSGGAPDFCVSRKGAREVPFELSDDGVVLPDHLRGRIAAAEKVGAVEFEVQVRLLQGGDARSGTGTPTWIWCKARMMAGGPGVVTPTPCTVLAPHNWFTILT